MGEEAKAGQVSLSDSQCCPTVLPSWSGSNSATEEAILLPANQISVSLASGDPNHSNFHIALERLWVCLCVVDMFKDPS